MFQLYILLPLVSFASLVKLGEGLLTSKTVLGATTVAGDPRKALRSIVGMSSINGTPSCCVRVQVISDFACPWYVIYP